VRHPGKGSARLSRRAKRRVFRWTPFLVLLALSALSAAASGDEEQMASNRPGGLVRDGCVMQVADADAHGIAEVSADCRWPVAPERVVEIIRNNDDIDEVLSSVSDSRVLADGRVVQVHAMGRLVADRQVTLRFHSREFDDGGVRIDFESAREQHRLGEGRVQIALDEGSWEIRPDGLGGTRLRYAVRYDAGGSLKPWIVRGFQKAGINRSMQEIRLAAEHAFPVSAEPADSKETEDTRSVSAPPPRPPQAPSSEANVSLPNRPRGAREKHQETR